MLLASFLNQAFSVDAKVGPHRAWGYFTGNADAVRYVDLLIPELIDIIVSGKEVLPADVDFACEYLIKNSNYPPVTILPVIGRHIEMSYMMDGDVNLVHINELMRYMPKTVTGEEIVQYMRIENKNVVRAIKSSGKMMKIGGGMNRMPYREYLRVNYPHE